MSTDVGVSTSVVPQYLGSFDDGSNDHGNDVTEVVSVSFLGEKGGMKVCSVFIERDGTTVYVKGPNVVSLTPFLDFTCP